MKIYIASSWKNQHAVEMLTALLRAKGHEVISFVEKCFDELNTVAKIGENEWINSPAGRMAFEYDTKGATESDLVIYIGPSGMDAAAEVGAAWAKGIPILGLWAKGDPLGLMRLMMSSWHDNYKDLLRAVEKFYKISEI
jgi:nucleoside 2-deoxyribosyltransferase